jgi:hypothetical protein
MDQYGGEKKSKKTKKTTKPNTKKPAAKKTTKTTKTRSKSKGGNFLGTVGDLVAPTGWGPFATAAGLLALGELDSTYRRGNKTDLKKETTKKTKMNGGHCQKREPGDIPQIKIAKSGMLFNYYNNKNINFPLSNYDRLVQNYNKWVNNPEKLNIVIACNENGRFYFKVNITCGTSPYTYEHLPKKNGTNNSIIYFYDTFEEAEKASRDKNIQIALVKLALIDKRIYCKY